jgi:hypothetical protein
MITESTLLVLTGWRPEFGITVFSANRWQRYTRPAGPGQATMKAGGLKGVLPKDSERGPLSLWSAAVSAEDQPQHGQTQGMPWE